MGSHLSIHIPLLQLPVGGGGAALVSFSLGYWASVVLSWMLLPDCETLGLGSGTCAPLRSRASLRESPSTVLKLRRQEAWLADVGQVPQPVWAWPSSGPRWRIKEEMPVWQGAWPHQSSWVGPAAFPGEIPPSPPLSPSFPLTPPLNAEPNRYLRLSFSMEPFLMSWPLQSGASQASYGEEPHGSFQSMALGLVVHDDHAACTTRLSCRAGQRLNWV